MRAGGALCASALRFEQVMLQRFGSVSGKVALANTLALIDDRPNKRTPNIRKSTIHNDPNVIAIPIM